MNVSSAKRNMPKDIKSLNSNLQERINIAPLVDLKERENSDELYKKWKISNA